VVWVDDFAICYFSSTPATKIAKGCQPGTAAARLTSHTSLAGGGMSLLKRLLGKSEPPKVRVRVCVECGMPLAEHKDWCAIYQQQLEREKLQAAKV
jgi:hypothetical protein